MIGFSRSTVKVAAMDRDPEDEAWQELERRLNQRRNLATSIEEAFKAYGASDSPYEHALQRRAFWAGWKAAREQND